MVPPIPFLMNRMDKPETAGHTVGNIAKDYAPSIFVDKLFMMKWPSKRNQIVFGIEGSLAE